MRRDSVRDLGIRPKFGDPGDAVTSNATSTIRKEAADVGAEVVYFLDRNVVTEEIICPQGSIFSRHFGIQIDLDNRALLEINLEKLSCETARVKVMMDKRKMPAIIN